MRKAEDDTIWKLDIGIGLEETRGSDKEDGWDWD